MSIHNANQILLGDEFSSQEEIGTFSFNYSNKTTGGKEMNLKLFFLILSSL